MKMPHPVDAAMQEYLKIIIGPLAAVIVAAVGWALTSAYNKTQFDIAIEKNKADVEVARINAALSFANIYRQIPEADTQQRDRAIAIAAPVLSPELAFDLALRTINRDDSILRILLAKYGDESWKYLAPAVEVIPLEFDDPTLFAHDADASSQGQSFDDYRAARIRAEALAHTLMTILDQQQHLDELLRYIVSDECSRPELRAYALLAVFQQLDAKMQYPKNTASEVRMVLGRIREMLADRGVSDRAKADIAIASSLVFDKYHSRPEFSDLVVPYFWAGLDIGRGETPAEYDLRSFVYRDRFHYQDTYQRTVTLPQARGISEDLATRFAKLSFRRLDFQQISLIMYSYIESTPRGGPSPFTAYLAPPEAVRIIKVILGSLASEARKSDFGAHLGSLGGDALFANISQDQESGRLYTKLIISWYDDNYRPGWPPPKFFDSIVARFPDLLPQINGKPYYHGGVTQPPPHPPRSS